MHQVHLMAHFSRWLGESGLLPGQVDRAAVAAFVLARRSEGYMKLLLDRALAPMIEYLRDLGVVPPEAPRPLTPDEVLLGEFGRYLLDERGLARDSVRSYVGVAQQFLAHMGSSDELEGLSAAAVSRFVRDECAPSRYRFGQDHGDRRAGLAAVPSSNGEDADLSRPGGAVGRELVARRPAPGHRHDGAGMSCPKL